MEEIREKLAEAVKGLYGVEIEPEVTPAPLAAEADYACNVALTLAGKLHRAPMEIAQEIAEELQSDSDATDASKRAVNGDGSNEQVGEDEKTRNEDFGFTVFVSPPGFLNFISPDEYLMAKMGDLVGNFEKNISSDEYRGKTVVCEFSDPNPFKVLHVGHLYTSVVGDAISRLYEYAGAKVVRANFGGDVGLHVAKTMYALLQENDGDTEKTLAELTIEMIARCYVAGTQAYEEDPAAKAEITRLNKVIYRINAEGEARDVGARERSSKAGAEEESSNVGAKIEGGAEGEEGGAGATNDETRQAVANLYWKGRELSYAYFKDFYRQIGVKFDKFYPESSVAELGLNKVKEELAAGVYEKSAGAVVFDGEKYGLHTRVFINREGVPTYEAKDVGLIFAKWRDWRFDKSVVITGNEQLEYMRVVLCSVAQYAPELTERTVHLTHGLVKLPGNVKMASRKGNFLRAVDVLEAVRDALMREFDACDERVMLGAVKYAFLRYKMGGNIVFDARESVKMNGNSGPYLLYSCVRAKKILVRAGADSEHNFFGTRSRALAQADGPEKVCSESAKMLNQKNGDGIFGSSRKIVSYTSPLIAQERELIKKLLEYRGVLAEAVKEMAPHKVVGYLYELAQDFSRFYEKCPVAGAAEETRRVQMVRGYLMVMTHGLGLMGIEVPEEM